MIMGNGITGQLQQSLFLFALPSIASPLFVSSYGFIDKLISSFRMLINAYGTAFMPRAAGLHKEGFDQWKMIKQQQNTILTIGCVLIALIMFIFPHQLLMLLFMGKKTEAAFFTQTAILIQAISMVPLLMALNVLNVAEVFLEKKYTLHFKGGLLLLLITVISITALKYTLPFFVAGYYPMIIEGASLIVSLSIVQKIRNAQP
jgi:O-antigen/teichoic acid export membrane protein